MQKHINETLQKNCTINYRKRRARCKNNIYITNLTNITSSLMYFPRSYITCLTLMLLKLCGRDRGRMYYNNNKMIFSIYYKINNEKYNFFNKFIINKEKHDLP